MKACITGSVGQIGSFLCERLLLEEWDVFGLKRSDGIVPDYFNDILNHPNFNIVYGDINERSLIDSFVSYNRPDIFINCASQSSVTESRTDPVYAARTTGDSVEVMLQAIKKYSPGTRFVTLGSSEMFGLVSPPPQNETSPFDMPGTSPYAAAKIKAYQATLSYRYDHKLFASNAICFNSESPRRPDSYVTRKITKAAAAIKLGLQDKLYLGNIQSLRDFSHASDVADAVYRIVTADVPDNFVIASGQSHSVQEFVEVAFGRLDLDWRNYVVIDPKFFRAGKENVFCGDVTKIKSKLGWEPKYDFVGLVNEMIDYDLKLAKKM